MNGFLVRTIKEATVITSPSVPAGEELLKSGKVDVFAANKANLFELSDKLAVLVPGIARSQCGTKHWAPPSSRSPTWDRLT